MARIRTIKPEFWQDELVASWPPMSRLAYIAMWNEADDEGRLRASAPYLRSRLFPYDANLDVFAIIVPIIKSGRIILYEIDGQTYGILPNFQKHQVINRPTPSKIPPFTEDSRSIHGALIVGREGKGKELKEPGPGRTEDKGPDTDPDGLRFRVVTA